MNKSEMPKNWHEITSEEAYRLSIAEFKGATLQALQSLDRRIASIETYNRDTRLVSLVISGISGIISGIFGVNLRR